MILVLQILGLFFAGILAGEEFVIRYGVQPSLRRLDDGAGVRARQALIMQLRVLVPVIMVPTVLLGIAVVVLGGGEPGFYFRIAGLAALVAFLLFAFLGTVPINIRVLEWDAGAPPADWKDIVRRWERLDLFRSSAALLAFALFVIALGIDLQLVA